ncbi:hypothetical protein [Chlorogloea sp. CCALA 695]|uniref:hypothetical protein n=1 Tax=Chlorogloea sp. CCALA 695 TaxID=2107693 RepID=UPI000D05B93D|nr:hypothetical protein [Chlorogloea sp. CCALA 695]PSB33475.1 hypothetical protein C7B70_06455 [Chlorogloea sp. CCALA 695]
MINFNKLKFGLNLLVVAPLAAGIAVINTSLSTVQAQTTNNSVETSAQLPENTVQFSISSTQIPAAAFLDASQYQTAFLEPNNSAAVTNNPLPSSQTVAANPENLDQLQQTAPALEQNVTPAPIPGTTATDANNLSKQPSIVNQLENLTDSPEVAQLPVAPGRRTRGGSSYVGLGVNVGLSGDTVLGDGNLMIISKIGLTNSLALRPGVILGDDPIILLPVTYEFSIRRAEALEESLRIAPYIGAGVTISTAEDDDIGLLLTGGIDVPLSSQFTANAGLNVGIADETDIGLSVGVGYNFGGFGL